MITKIYVDGFKSLKEFELNFDHGLNILVGPNGAGKTNIVSFFEFIAHLMDTDASEATSRTGGAGAVFRRVGTTYERTITARIYGCVPVEVRRTRREQKLGSEEEKPFCGYEYSFSLVFPEEADSVFFKTQRLKLVRLDRFTKGEDLVKIEKWGLDLEARFQTDGTTEVTTNAFDDSLLEFPYYPRRVKAGGNNPDVPKPEEVIAEILESGTISLVPAISRYTPNLWAISRDLTGGQIYNVVPSKLKLPEDSARAPGISRDGSGLAATLYALQRSKNPPTLTHIPYFYHHGRHQYDPSGMDQLKAYLGLVNSTVEDILVENDAFENLLRVRFKVHSGEYEASLPLALMSDGTLKWLAVVTAAITAPSVFCIEEPENYLHPQMQGQIVTILREILFQDDSHRFTLMTTHSETLLNHCRPEELIIVSMSGGHTRANRCSNAADVSNEISRTGFGLGYYYVSDALQND
ncbi:AAA family ATPase [Akkermansiaceae bacterium]|nr:AAA family ATPase [Akkermansiaceae bacterium]